MLTVASLTFGATGCGDNYDGLFEPRQTERTLALDVSSDIYTNGKLSLGAAPSTVEVAVESNTHWKVEVTDCDGGWCEVSAFNGSGNGDFTISVRENLKEERTCFVKVYKVDAAGEKETDGSREITVSQVASDVRLFPSSVESFPSHNPETEDFEIVANVEWTLTVTYDTESADHFMKVIPIDGMSRDSEEVFSGNGAAKFRLELQDNRTAASRTGFITLRSEVGTYSVEITQLKSDYTFDVSPAERQTVGAEGGVISFGVLSLSDWKVETAANWITFSSTEGAASDSRSEVTAKVQPNISGVERSAEIHFMPTDSKYQGLSVTVAQSAYDLTFYVSPEETLGVLMSGFQTKTFAVNSRFNWQIETSDWISASPSQGEPHAGEQKIGLSIKENNEGYTRNGSVTVVPLPTEFEDGVVIDPEQLNIKPVMLTITQFGGREPAISAPWLAEGYTQTSATVEFNYYSPFYDIKGSGIQWKEENAGEWNDVKDEDLVVGVDGTVSVNLTNLKAATRYVARGYVIYSGGDSGEVVKYGAISVPFTTAGVYPGENDNPTPGI